VITIDGSNLVVTAGMIVVKNQKVVRLVAGNAEEE